MLEPEQIAKHNTRRGFCRQIPSAGYTSERTATEGVHQKHRKREMPGALCIQQPGSAIRQLHFQGQPNRRIASNLPSALPLPSLIPGSAIPQLGSQIFNFSIYITPWHKIYMSPWGLIGRVNIFNFLDVLEPGNPKQGYHKSWFLLKPHLSFLTDISFPHLLF